MSHFSVLVIGDDFESQLAPYHEFECTGVDDEYVQNIDKLAEAKREHGERAKAQSLADFIHGWYGAPVVGVGQEPDLAGEHKYGWVRLDEFGHVVEFIERTNPNAKWDWYEVGGRWRGFFQAKQGAAATIGNPGVFDNAPTFNADTIRKGDVDFEGMRAVAAADAEITYTRYEEVIGGTPEPESWEVIRERCGVSHIDTARRVFHEQPRISALEKAEMMPWASDPSEVYGGGREAYVQRQVDAVAIPYAIVKDGQWVGQGEMGWFGMSHNEAEQGEWNRAVQELYAGLSDDVLLTLIDCHI